MFVIFFFFNDTATTEIYTTVHTLSLHDALPMLTGTPDELVDDVTALAEAGVEHIVLRDRKSTRLTPVTDCYLVCRLLLEKKKKQRCQTHHATYFHNSKTKIQNSTNS